MEDKLRTDQHGENTLNSFAETDCLAIYILYTWHTENRKKKYCCQRVER